MQPSYGEDVFYSPVQFRPDTIMGSDCSKCCESENKNPSSENKYQKFQEISQSCHTEKKLLPTKWATLNEHLLAGNFAKFDLIEIKRKLKKRHWGIYLGTRDMVHVVFSTRNGTGCIRKEDIGDVVDRSKCRVNNQLDAALSKGLKPLPEKDVESSISLDFQPFSVNAARSLETRVRYNLTSNNCEHYATKWKYGRGFSTQIERWGADTVNSFKVLCTNLGYESYEDNHGIN